jgi:RNA polymerase sigma-70 factor (ECF subfamily)
MVDRADHRRLIEQFRAAAYAADERVLMRLLSSDVAVVSDGGGKITAARKVIHGVAKVMRLFTIALPLIKDHITTEIIEINGEPGIVEYYDGSPFAATTVTIENGRIVAMYRVMNPEKLRAFKK